MTTDHTIVAGAVPAAVGKYRIDGVLGQGAMGIVYAGHDPDIERDVAIKTIHTHLVAAEDRADWLDRFAREVRAAGRVLHPNLVTIFDFLQQDDTPFLVMEKVEATTLEERINTGPGLALDEIVSITGQVLRGLGCIHDAGIVHRDIKPANIMLTGDGTVKLADFGIARFQAMGATGTGMIGTPNYMAPEQFDGQRADHRADIFACGVVLYELITGRNPFPTDSLAARIGALQAGDVTPPSVLAAGVRPSIDAAVATALRFDPAERHNDAAAFLGALTGAPDEPASHNALTGARRPVKPDMPADAVLRLQTSLVEQVGPIGKVIARRAAAASGSVEEMFEIAARESGTVLATSPQAAPAATPDQPGSAPEISAKLHDALKALLAPSVGPIAGVLIKRKLSGAPTFTDLVEALAAEISDPAERAAFVKQAHALRSK